MLNEKGACQPAIDWLNEQNTTDPIRLAELARSAGRIDWIYWIATSLMTKRQRVEYAVFAAELVIHIFEQKYPTDDRPRKAIEAAKEYLRTGDAADTARAAYVAADEAYAAYEADAAYAADAAAYAADTAGAADAAAYAAEAAAYAAYAADVAADAAHEAYAAVYAAYAAARAEIQDLCIEKAFEILGIKK